MRCCAPRSPKPARGSARREEQAGRDPLTALHDPRQFRAELERVLSQAARHGTPAALISVDLKDLKAINEGHGRIAGDAALRHVARLLKSLIRTSDVAARGGGGAFSLMLDHLDADSALDTAERIARCISAHPLDIGHALVKLEATVERRHDHARRHGRGSAPPRRPQPRARQGILTAAQAVTPRTRGCPATSTRLSAR